MYDFSQENNGFIVLIAVLIISAFVILLGLTMSLLGVGEASMGLVDYQSSISYYLANACAEHALEQIRIFSSFEGLLNLAMIEGDCDVEVIVLSPQTRQVNAWSSENGITRRIKIMIDQVSPVINIASWQEVSNF